MELAEIECTQTCDEELKASSHVPVLKNEVVEALQAKKGGVYLDCTLGGGGHTRALLEANPFNRVVAVDRDERAVKRAAKTLQEFSSRIELHYACISELKSLCLPHAFDGILADLGVSSDQLSENRGFSFSDTSRLDMRMDQNQSFSAYNVVNDYSERDLFMVLKRGGVGGEAQAVTRAIVKARPIRTTQELSQVVQKAAYGISSKRNINPATVTLQAIRIEVNSEFQEIECLLEQAPTLIKRGGRLAIITFHSLEDKIVTATMRAWQSAGKWPALWPNYGKDYYGWSYANNKKPLGKLIGRAIVPGVEELVSNPRSRSARLRVFEFFAL